MAKGKGGSVVAVASDGLRGEVREFGRIANTATALDRMRLGTGQPGATLVTCIL
jgi:hypothetical protein